jgi:hypothetical protein
VGAAIQWQENRQAEEVMLVLPACAEEESMEITRLPYSEGLLLTQSTQHPEHAFQLQEALALLVPGESLIIRLGDSWPLFVIADYLGSVAPVSSRRRPRKMPSKENKRGGPFLIYTTQIIFVLQNKMQRQNVPRK